MTLYGRDGCHLCDEARDGLEAMLSEGVEFQMREVDIEVDDRLHRELLDRIPVIEVDGVRVSELWFDRDAVLARVDTFPA